MFFSKTQICFTCKGTFLFHIVMKFDITKDRIWLQIEKKMGVCGMKRDEDCVKISFYVV